MDNFLKGVLVVAGGFVTVYAIRSYGYQKECQGYKNGVLVTVDAYEKKYKKEE